MTNILLGKAPIDGSSYSDEANFTDGNPATFGMIATAGFVVFDFGAAYVLGTIYCNNVVTYNGVIAAHVSNNSDMSDSVHVGDISGIAGLRGANNADPNPYRYVRFQPNGSDPSLSAYELSVNSGEPDPEPTPGSGTITGLWMHLRSQMQ